MVLGLINKWWLRVLRESVWASHYQMLEYLVYSLISIFAQCIDKNGTNYNLKQSFYVTNLIFRRTSEEVCECLLHVLRKSRRKHILILTELVPRLSHNRVYHVKTRYLILWLALLYKLFNTVHYMFIELDGFYSTSCDCTHFCLRYRRFVVVQPG